MGTLGGGLGNTLYDAGSGLVSLPGQAVKGYKGETSTKTATEGVEAKSKDAGLEQPAKEVGSQAKKAEGTANTNAKKAESSLKD